MGCDNGGSKDYKVDVIYADNSINTARLKTEDDAVRCARRYLMARATAKIYHDKECAACGSKHSRLILTIHAH